MLPESRTQDGGFAIPRFDLTPRDVEEFLDELQAFHDHFRSYLLLASQDALHCPS